jgi:ABC-type nitrate/sulfonate/bicarbonate transport system substrate-binding protein
LEVEMLACRVSPDARPLRVRRARLMLALAVFVLTCCLAGTAAAGVQKPALTNLKVGIAGGINTGSLYWDEMVGEAQGFFKKHGLDVSFINTQNGPTTAQTLLGGSIDIGVGATDSFTAAVQRGAPLKLLTFNTLSPEALVVTKDIKSYQDLVGKKVAVTSLGAGSSLILFKMLEANHVDPKSVNFVLSGATPQRFAAMVSGAVQATLVAPPDDQTALQQGFRVLQYSQQVFNYMFISSWVSRSWAEKNPQAVAAYVAALQEAHNWMVKVKGKKYVPLHEYRASHILARYVSSNQKACDITYKTIFKTLKAITPSVRPNKPVLLQTLQVLGQPTDNLNQYF